MTVTDLHLTQGRPAIGMPGRAALERRPGAPSAPFGRPDIALAEREGAGWTLIGASGRGIQHAFAGEPRQDAFGVVMVGETLCVVVADGVGSYARSHEAADAAVALACAGLAAGVEVETVVDDVNAHLRELEGDGGGELATTLLIARVDWVGDTATLDLTWVGDPYVWALTLDGMEWINEVAGSDDAVLASTASRALPAASVVMHRRSVTLVAQGLFFMTDGVGTPLEYIDDVRSELAHAWAERPTVYEFAAQVEFARRGYMDDRTVVGVWPVGTGEPEDETVADVSDRRDVDGGEL